MKCPRCGKTLISEFHPTRKGLWRCRLCNAIWTDWQQSEIARLRAGLDALKARNAEAEKVRKLREGLKEHQYDQCHVLGFDHQEEYHYCCGCGSELGEICSSDCWLAALLEETK